MTTSEAIRVRMGCDELLAGEIDSPGFATVVHRLWET